MDSHTTLVATLGGQPQVVTFTLDLLLARREKIDQVVVIFPGSSPRYRDAFQRLAEEFYGDEYAGQPCHLRSTPIQLESIALDDIRSRSEVEAARRTFHELLSDLKDQNQTIHLSLTGGRRVMSLIGLAAATQYLAPTDRIWHIYTPTDLREEAESGAIMHVPEESGIQLIEVPFVPWVAYFPGLAPLLTRSTQEMREAEMGWLSKEERKRCRQVWSRLTPRRRDVLRVFALGLTRQQAAMQLNIETSTLDTHRDAILDICRLVWKSYEGKLDIHFLRERFGPFLRGIGELS